MSKTTDFEALGHNGSKAIEIYAHVSNREPGKIKSPLNVMLYREESSDRVSIKSGYMRHGLRIYHQIRRISDILLGGYN